MQFFFKLMQFVAATQPINALAFVFDGINFGASDFAYSAYSMVSLQSPCSLTQEFRSSIFISGRKSHCRASTKKKMKKLKCIPGNTYFCASNQIVSIIIWHMTNSYYFFFLNILSHLLCAMKVRCINMGAFWDASTYCSKNNYSGLTGCYPKI